MDGHEHQISEPVQAGSTAAHLVSNLRSRSGFLQSVAACISAPPPDSPRTAGAEGMHANMNTWADGAWRFLTEAHALSILTTEAFLNPKEEGNGACLFSQGTHHHTVCSCRVELCSVSSCLTLLADCTTTAAITTAAATATSATTAAAAAVSHMTWSGQNDITAYQVPSIFHKASV